MKSQKDVSLRFLSKNLNIKKLTRTKEVLYTPSKAYSKMIMIEL